jgi:hypothetical protein
MAENIPTPSGAIPPKKETGKVQPKKETVRINLPPKPSAAPTIKLPTLPPGGPTGAPSAAAPGAAPVAAAAPSRAQAAPVAQRPTAAAAPMAPRPPAMAPMAAGPSTLDKILAVAVIVVGLAAAGSVVFVWLIPTD